MTKIEMGTQRWDKKFFPITLKIEDEHPHDAVPLIGWCIPGSLSASLAKALVSCQIQKAYILLVIATGEDLEQEEVGRYLFPLTSQAAFISFKRPGIHNVYATIVWHEAGDVRGVYLSTRPDRGYERELISRFRPREEAFLSMISRFDSMGFGQLQIDVGAQYFAPEPSEMEKRWVNFFFKTKARDQCHFRKRRIFAYLVQPFIFPCYIVFWAALQLLSCSFRLAVAVCLNVVAVGSGLVSCLRAYGRRRRKSIDPKEIERQRQRVERQIRQEEEAWKRECLKELRSELRTLSCELQPEYLSLAALPKQPIRLRFQDFKRKVCRPFMQ